MTPARKRALAWFAAHDADPTSVLFKTRPSTKMCRLMRREGQLNAAWHLTPIGRTLSPPPAGEGANASPALSPIGVGRC